MMPRDWERTKDTATLLVQERVRGDGRACDALEVLGVKALIKRCFGDCSSRREALAHGPEYIADVVVGRLERLVDTGPSRYVMMLRILRSIADRRTIADATLRVLATELVKDMRKGNLQQLLLTLGA